MCVLLIYEYHLIYLHTILKRKSKGWKAMFIYNLKVDGNKLGKIFLGILFVIILIITVVVCYRVLGNNFFKTNDSIKIDDVQELNVTNYTNVLKNVHENLDNYIGQKIKFSGYVYRMIDFTEKEFVLGRDMIISSDFQTVVVGFLCECDEAINYEDKTWIEIEGEITKGNYHGEMPIIRIEKIQKIEKPSEEYVYPPDDSFVTTSTSVY